MMREKSPRLFPPVTDIQGKLIESHTHDSHNRRLTSQRADGADSLSLTHLTIRARAGRTPHSEFSIQDSPA